MVSALKDFKVFWNIMFYKWRREYGSRVQGDHNLSKNVKGKGNAHSEALCKIKWFSGEVNAIDTYK